MTSSSFFCTCLQHHRLLQGASPDAHLAEPVHASILPYISNLSVFLIKL